MEEWLHRRWPIRHLWGCGLAPKGMWSFCGKGGVLFTASGVPPQEGFQSRALGPGDWKTQTRVRMGAQGAWEAP